MSAAIRGRSKSSQAVAAVCAAVVFTALSLPYSSLSFASDHADPIDPFNRERLEGGITDLFVFPVTKDDKPAVPYEGNRSIPLHYDPADLARTMLTTAQRGEIDALVMILCVRRSLTPTDKLNLTPYTFRIQVDWDSPTIFAQKDTEEDLKRAKTAKSSGYAPTSDHDHDPPAAAPPRPTPQEAFLRYGGAITNPDDIQEDLTIEFRLNDEGALEHDYPKFLDAQSVPKPDWQGISTFAGEREDPFIFPAFFGTNVVAMAVRIPIVLFPKKRDADLLVWATSHKGNRQVDHVGRSLRTQNPRFEMLNTAHPRDHRKLILEEHNHPSIQRDLATRFNLGSLFSYRRWDFVPDVMIYTTKYHVGFPNGRLLTDDVAALLAQHGDTLLYELSFQHQNGGWPRETANDGGGGKFGESFPFLLPVNETAKSPTPLKLSDRNRWILILIALAAIVVIVLENWIVARIYYRIKSRRRFL